MGGTPWAWTCPHVCVSGVSCQHNDLKEKVSFCIRAQVTSVTLHPWWYLLSRICLTLVFRTPYILLLPEWSGCPRFPSVCLFLLTFFLNSPEASSSDFADEAWGLSVLGFLKTSLSLHSWVGLSGGALGGQRPPLGPESPCHLLSFLCFLPSFW